jgi:hypothetical protein
MTLSTPRFLQGTRTKAHKAVVEAQQEATILATGTPISNRPIHLGGLLRILWRSYMEEEFDLVMETDAVCKSSLFRTSATFTGRPMRTIAIMKSITGIKTEEVRI